MRPKHPHAAESGVGKHTARESERVQACAAGKERVTNAHPHKLASEASKASEAFSFLESAMGRTDRVFAAVTGRIAVMRRERSRSPAI